MSKKLEANGLWEASRMMLPQHKERIIEHRSRDNDLTKPFLHEDEWEIIGQNLMLSLNYTLEARIVVFNEMKNRNVCGIVSAINDLGEKIKMEFDNGYEWIDFDRIVSVTVMGIMNYETNT